MKSIIKLSLIAIVIFLSACKKDDPEPTNNTQTVTPPPPTSNQYDDYWGCWREANGNPGAYDIILIENQTEPHTFQFGTLCVGDPVLAQDIGVFRNDTLILDNGTYEFWCFIVSDTMLYSAYGPSATTEKFIKI